MSAQAMKKIKFAIIIFYLSLFTILALYDEAPNPERVREMEQPLPEIMEPGNAWLAFLGFEAPKGMSPYFRGKEILRKLQDVISKGKDPGNIRGPMDDGKKDLHFQGVMPSFYGEKDGGIVAFAAAHPDRVAALVRNNRDLLERYDALRKFPHYTEAIDYGFYMPFPMFSPIRNAQRTKLLQLAAGANRGNVAEALAAVRDDVEFWRFIARNSKTLISKLVAISILNTNLRFTAELGTSHSLNDREMQIVRSILRPFDRGEISIAEAFRGEARCSQKGMELTYWRKLKKWNPEKLFFKQEATDNLMYSHWLDSVRLAELPPLRYAAETRRRESAGSNSRRIGLRFLYNPIGEFLDTIATPCYTAYIERGHDLEGLRRLALLKVLSRQENVPPKRMQQFLDSCPADLKNPYTGAPMTWNAKSGSTSFIGMKADKPIEIGMYYEGTGKPPAPSDNADKRRIR